MKKALIISLGLAMVFGLTGCEQGDKIKDAVNSAKETVQDTVEKPVMVLGEGLEEATDAVNNTVDKAGETVEKVTDTAKEAVEDTAEAVVDTGSEMAEKADDLLEEATE